MDILTNTWWNWIASDYSISIALATTAFLTALKCIAILYPGAKTNKIVELFQSLFTRKWNGEDRRK